MPRYPSDRSRERERSARLEKLDEELEVRRAWSVLWLVMRTQVLPYIRFNTHRPDVYLNDAVGKCLENTKLGSRCTHFAQEDSKFFTYAGRDHVSSDLLVVMLWSSSVDELGGARNWGEWKLISTAWSLYFFKSNRVRVASMCWLVNDCPIYLFSQVMQHHGVEELKYKERKVSEAMLKQRTSFNRRILPLLTALAL